MKAALLAALFLGALPAAASALAADNEAGVSLAPGDAAGPWTLEAAGHSICVLTLSARHVGGGFAVSVPAACGAAIPPGVAAWTPTAHGMDMIDASGQSMVGFGRWSNSLLVSHQGSGPDLQLKRGGPAG